MEQQVNENVQLQNVQQVEDVKTTKGNLWGISPYKIVVVEGFNSRQNFGNLDELAEQIKEQGVLNPITVQAFKDENGEEKYHLVDGERRYRAVMQILKEDPEKIKRIPAIIVPKNLSQEELLIQQVLRNEGKKFNEYEMALWCQKLMQISGYTKQEVAKKLGKSVTLVIQWLQLLEIDNSELRDAAKSGEINGSLLRDVLKKNKGDEKKTLDELNEAKAEAKKRGKDNVSAKDFTGNFLAQKNTQDIKKGLELVIKYFKDYYDVNDLATPDLNNLPVMTIINEIKKGKTIDVVVEEIAKQSFGLAI